MTTLVTFQPSSGWRVTKLCTTGFISRWNAKNIFFFNIEKEIIFAALKNKIWKKYWFLPKAKSCKVIFKQFKQDLFVTGLKTCGATELGPFLSKGEEKQVMIYVANNWSIGNCRKKFHKSLQTGGAILSTGHFHPELTSICLLTNV